MQPSPPTQPHQPVDGGSTDIGMFLKQKPKQNLKVEPTSKFPSPQGFIVSPRMVLKSKPSYVDTKVKQPLTIFRSHKSMTCWDVKVKFTSFWSQEIYSLLLRSQQLTQVMLGFKKNPGALGHSPNSDPDLRSHQSCQSVVLLRQQWAMWLLDN